MINVVVLTNCKDLLPSTEMDVNNVKNRLTEIYENHEFNLVYLEDTYEPDEVIGGNGRTLISGEAVDKFSTDFVEEPRTIFSGMSKYEMDLFKIRLMNKDPYGSYIFIRHNTIDNNLITQHYKDYYAHIILGSCMHQDYHANFIDESTNTEFSIITNFGAMTSTDILSILDPVNTSKYENSLTNMKYNSFITKCVADGVRMFNGFSECVLKILRRSVKLFYIKNNEFSDMKNKMISIAIDSLYATRLGLDFVTDEIIELNQSNSPIAQSHLTPFMIFYVTTDSHISIETVDIGAIISEVSGINLIDLKSVYNLEMIVSINNIKLLMITNIDNDIPTVKNELYSLNQIINIDF